MKNVTITMEDSVADWARVEAAKRNISLSRMLGDMLAEKMRRDDAYGRAMREELAFNSLGTSSGPYFTKEEAHDRAQLRKTV